MRTFTSSDGLTIRVGENAGENQELCKEAKQNDLWFHLEGRSSPHAILSVASGKAGKSSGVRTSVHECQQLVKHFSSARQARQASVIWIEAKWVSKNGVEDRVGAVTLKKSPQKASVVADEGTIEALLSQNGKSTSS